MKVIKEIPILLLGFGSIGRRHYKNLRSLGYKNIAVLDPDDKVFNGFGSVSRIKNLAEETVKNYKTAFVCCPNNLHIKHALICAKAGCHLFIEKPLSHNLAGIRELSEICREKKLINLVGCNMRFHPCLGFIKSYLEKGKLGRIYSISHEFGYYLPYWRPNQDYRKNYAAKKSTGGGIILDDIHEFDLLFWLNDFKLATEVKFISGKASDLQIETEDICFATFKFKNKVLGSVKCDYLQQSYSRKCKIVGEKGNLEWDFKENIVWLKIKEDNKKLFEIKNFDFNNVYIEELKYFFQCINNKKESFNGINTAYSILKYCVSKNEK